MQAAKQDRHKTEAQLEILCKDREGVRERERQAEVLPDTAHT